jgi:Co/Zn/Cd efflux system component
LSYKSGCKRAPVENFQHKLIASLVTDAGMFVVEMSAGLTVSSASRRANAVDFLGNSANYALSLCVMEMRL